MEKIQELTEKIYREGVEKGQAEAARIIEKAKEQAASIIKEARQQAEATQQQAEKQAAELDAHTKSELKLYMAQAMSALKSEVANILTDKVVTDEVEKLSEDKDFLGKFAITLAEKWQGDEPAMIMANDADSLKTYFMKHAKALLDKGVKIEKVNGIDTLFTIQPQDGSYKVNFGKDEFEAYFKAFLRPQLVEMLF